MTGSGSSASSGGAVGSVAVAPAAPRRRLERSALAAGLPVEKRRKS
jgi:hypothetical protein